MKNKITNCFVEYFLLFSVFSYFFTNSIQNNNIFPEHFVFVNVCFFFAHCYVNSFVLPNVVFYYVIFYIFIENDLCCIICVVFSVRLFRIYRIFLSCFFSNFFPTGIYVLHVYIYMSHSYQYLILCHQINTLPFKWLFLEFSSFAVFFFVLALNLIFVLWLNSYTYIVRPCQKTIFSLLPLLQI